MKNPEAIPFFKRGRARHEIAVEPFVVRTLIGRALFDHSSSVVVLAQSDELRMTQPVCLRSCLDRAAYLNLLEN